MTRTAITFLWPPNALHGWFAFSFHPHSGFWSSFAFLLTHLVYPFIGITINTNAKFEDDTTTLLCMLLFLLFFPGAINISVTHKASYYIWTFGKNIYSYVLFVMLFETAVDCILYLRRNTRRLVLATSWLIWWCECFYIHTSYDVGDWTHHMPHTERNEGNLTQQPSDKLKSYCFTHFACAALYKYNAKYTCPMTWCGVKDLRGPEGRGVTGFLIGFMWVFQKKNIPLHDNFIYCMWCQYTRNHKKYVVYYR